jgi:diguanylate cyclase (GGDEF)-like protein
MDGEKKSITAHDLKQALVHIRTLIFGEHAYYDDHGHLREILREQAVVFDEDTADQTAAELHTEIEHLKRLVHKDELTGLLNRRGVREEFGRFFKEALYTKDHPEQRTSVVISDFSVIFFDIDNFKSINDTYGHDEGDRVLREVADTLVHHVRDIDAVGRFGGEEFVVALLGANEDRAFEKGEDIRATIESRITLPDEASVTVSVGISSLHHSQCDTLEELIDCADKAMYEAKHHRGKNAVVRYSELS